MYKIFNQPFPRNNDVSACIGTGLFFGLFVFFFLWLFRPFGINDMQSANQVGILGGYGLVTAVIIIFHNTILPLYFRNHFDELNWTVGKEIIHTLGVIFFIGVANALYSYSMNMFDLSLDSLFRFQVITLTVSVLPVILMVLLRQNRLLKKNLFEAQKLTHLIRPIGQEGQNKKDSHVLLVAENGKDQFSSTVHSIIYIAAADNYIEIFYTENEKLSKVLLRSSLKKAQEQLSTFPSLYRCHRAYMVNLEKIVSVTGNAQGYKLSFNETAEQVPVSRNLNKELSEKLMSIRTK